MTSFRVTINGQRWTVKFVRSIRHKGQECWGLCNADKREIRIDRKARGQELIDTLIHEMLHGAGWHIDEPFVAAFAGDAAAALVHPKFLGQLNG